MTRFRLQIVKATGLVSISTRKNCIGKMRETFANDHRQDALSTDGRRIFARIGLNGNNITTACKCGVRAVLLSVFIVVGAMLFSDPVTAGDQSLLCESVAAQAAVETGVPVSVLKAITLTETGRNRGGLTRPWPWTVNMEGKGVWFESDVDALAYVEEHLKRGARSFDVGCFQINYKWHHQNFVSVSAMLDPLENALYAARYLKSLHQDRGDWEEAAGAYHSRTPEYAQRYRARFAAFRAQLLHEDDATSPAVSVQASAVSPSGSGPVLVRRNSYPLLQSGGAGALGSLVPLPAIPAGANLFRDDSAS